MPCPQLRDQACLLSPSCAQNQTVSLMAEERHLDGRGTRDLLLFYACAISVACLCQSVTHAAADRDKAAINTLTCLGGRVSAKACGREACVLFGGADGNAAALSQTLRCIKAFEAPDDVNQHTPLPREPVAGRLPAAPGWGRGTPRLPAHPGLLRRNAGGGGLSLRWNLLI